MANKAWGAFSFLVALGLSTGVALPAQAAPSQENPGVLESAPLRSELKPQQDQTERSTETERRHSLPQDVPVLAYTFTADGARERSLGVAAIGEGRLATGQNAYGNGGLRLWVVPIDRLRVVLDAQRREENGEFAPSLTAQVRLWSSQAENWNLGLLARYKAEGFAELEGEVEGGVLLSFKQSRLFLDANLIGGGDFDGGESDAEALLRGGYEVLPFFRLGAEGRARYRLSGRFKLPGDRDWDAFGGAQAMAFNDHFYGALTLGPSTVGVVDGIGWTGFLSVGGMAF